MSEMGAEPVVDHFSDFVTSRAISMKSCAVGLIVRLFNVTIPTAHGSTGSSIGSALIESRLPPNRKRELGNIVR